jgi:hypothetical protein
MSVNSLNLSSFDFTSFIICNNISFIQFNDAHNASGVRNRGLINDDIFKIINTNIDNNFENMDFFICINFRWAIEMSKEISTMIVVPYRSIAFHLRNIVNQTLISNHTVLIAKLICYFCRMNAFLVLFKVLTMTKPAFHLAREQCQQYKTRKMLSECHPH